MLLRYPTQHALIIDNSQRSKPNNGFHRLTPKVADGTIADEGEDIDLESRTECLPLSPLLLSHAKSVVQLLDSDIQYNLWSVLSGLANASSERLRLQGGADAHQLTPRGLHDYSSMFADVDAPVRPVKFDASRLTSHEFILGVAMLLVGKYSLVAKTRVTGKSQVTKSHTTPKRRSHLLMTVFSITSFIELSEKWYCLPCPPRGSPSRVSNTDALDIRRCVANLA